MHITISGYYGFGNTGDEAVLAGMLAGFREVGINADITILSADPTRTSSEHPGVNAVHRYKIGQVINTIRTADLVISGGGSLLQDVTSARSVHYYLVILRLAHLFKRKTMIYAQGIGPINRPGIRSVVAKVLNRVDRITVRDTDSQSLLKSIGVTQPITVVSDPSFLVEPDMDAADCLLADLNLTGKPLVGVALRAWPGDWLAPAVKAIEEACSEIGVTPLLIPMQETEDTQVCDAIKTGLIAHTSGDVHLTKGLIAHCRLIVAMRLHALIFAASEAIPFVPIVYDPKVESFTSAANQPPGIYIETMDAGVLKQAIIDASAHRTELTDRLTRCLPDLRRLAVTPAEIALNLLHPTQEH